MDAKSYHHYRCKKWSTVLGCYLLTLTAGFMWYWGNMAIYAISLILSHEAPSSYVLAPWTLSIYMVSLSVGIMACGALLKCTSIRMVIFLGAILGTCGTLLSCISVLHSMTFFNATMGFLVGLGDGLLNGACLQCVAVWEDGDLAFLMGLVQSAVNFGGIVTNQFVTLYVNPRDQTPGTAAGGLTFFSQEDVIGNVSSMILVLGCAHLVIKVIGLAMIRPRHANTNTSSITPAPISLELNESMAILEEDRRRPTNTGSIISQPKNTSSTSTQMTWEQMVRSKEFYLILFAFLSAEMGFYVIMNYYKLFGQLYIKDDHFLTNVGTYMSIFGIGGKVFSGYVTDKLGVKNSLIIVLSILITFGSFHFFTILVNDWLHTLFTVFLGSSIASQSLFSGFIGKQFGKDNFSANYGVLSLCQMALLLFLPVVIENCVFYFGWFAVTFLATIPATLALISAQRSFRMINDSFRSIP